MNGSFEPINFVDLKINFFYSNIREVLTVLKSIGLYFLLFTGNRVALIYMMYGDHFIQYTPRSLGNELGNITLVSVFLDTLPNLGYGQHQEQILAENIDDAPAMVL